MTRRPTWKQARFVAAAAILTILVWRLGAGPFLDGIRAVDAGALLAATGLGVLTNLCLAWRWKTVARGLGIDLPLRAALGAYYRSVFLNVTLPGGVVGDVHRGVSHGRDAGDVGRGLRAVVWERSAGQVVQAVLTVVVLLGLPSPVQSHMPLIALGLLAAAFGIVVLAKALPGRGRSWWSRLRAGAARDIRDGLLVGRAWLDVTLSSVVVVGCQAATFLIAARVAGATAPLSTMLPLALLVMAAMVLPNVGGWGPREGMAAWVFGAAGLGAQHGVATAVAFGVMVFVANLPGAAVLLVGVFKRAEPADRLATPQTGKVPAVAASEGAGDA